MASLNKLAIRGIRSFDDKQISVIEFFSPVTVIVGANGSGKTTIIECLKYATTGEQPPNTRGGAFIHDPVLANEKEVKAQVKLRFNAANGTRMLAVRNLQVSRKKAGGLAMKTLENILSLADAPEGNKRATISTKCAEIDEEIPHLLGVSKSVLENVIFCHQEDSYWPLSEPATLKKKFDDIFEATRYTKALDAIKNLRKERVAELKVEKERLQSLANEKGHADKLRGKISDLTKSITSKQFEYEKLGEEHQRVMTANIRFYEQSNQFRATYLKVQSLAEDIKRLDEQLKRMTDDTTNLKDSEEDLRHQLHTLDDRMAALRKEQGNFQRQVVDKQEEVDLLQASVDDLVEKSGLLQAMAKAHEGNIQDREKTMKDLAVQYTLGSVGPGTSAVKFLTALQDVEDARQRDVLALNNEGKVKRAEFEARWTKITEEETIVKGQRQLVRDEQTKLNNAITEAQRLLSGSTLDTSELPTHESELEAKRLQLETMKQTAKEASYESKLADLARKMKDLEKRRDEIYDEQKALAGQSEARASLNIKRQEITKQNKELEALMRTSNDKYQYFLGRAPAAATMEREVERLWSEKERELNERQTDFDVAQRKMNELDMQVADLKARHGESTKQAKELEKKLAIAMGDETKPIQEVIQSHQESITEIARDSASTDAQLEVFKHIFQKSKDKKSCVTCNRAIGDHERAAVESYMDRQLQKNARQDKDDADLAYFSDEVARLQKLLPHEQNKDRLRSIEIPQLKADLERKQGEIPEAAAKLEKAMQDLEGIKKEQRELSALRTSASNVTRIRQGLQALEHDVEMAASQIDDADNMRPSDVIEADLKEALESWRKSDAERAKLSTERERNTRDQAALRDRTHVLDKMVDELKRRVEEVKRLEQSIEDSRRDIEVNKKKLADLDLKARSMDVPRTSYHNDKRGFEEDFNQRVDVATALVQEIRRSIESMTTMSSRIDEYVKGNHARRLEENARNRIKEQSRLKAAQAELAEINERKNACGMEVANSASTRATLRGNIEIHDLGRQIAGKKEEMAGIDIDSAAKAKRHFELQYPKDKQRENELASGHSRMLGEIDMMKSNLVTLEKDMEDFKDVVAKYRGQLIKVKMSDMANNDLEKYGKALDHAIMKYHTLKMEEVNDTMKHLWNKTYQGTDIDAIRISADSEGVATTGRRSYNYRVVMTKDHVEMDMRGRCSAGQKMLASIIIRLALSDSFGQNCGILALDEPTNALDVDNIDALAGSLVDIINARKGNSSFQLVVITHDEHFLRKLGDAEVMEYYWRVSRDAKQKSVIERQRFG